MRIGTAIERLIDNYEYASDKEWIRDKVAWALYHTWKEADDRKTENSSEKPNNFKWSVEYAKEMLDTMPCEECGHWEHGAGDHYYCALLEMRQKCYFELKGESTLMFANKPKTEPTISKMEQVDEPKTQMKTQNSNLTFEKTDEPQTDCGDFADRLAYERGIKHAWEVAQKVFNSTVTFYEAEDVAKQMSKDEPQTGRSE